MSKEKHEALYHQIPSFQCKPGCTDCCGPIPFSKHEWDKVKNKRKTKSTSCPYIANGKCSIYQDRPLMCRLYGTTAGLACPHGCRPMALLSKGQTDKIMSEYIDLVREC